MEKKVEEKRFKKISGKKKKVEKRGKKKEASREMNRERETAEWVFLSSDDDGNVMLLAH